MRLFTLQELATFLVSEHASSNLVNQLFVNISLNEIVAMIYLYENRH